MTLYNSDLSFEPLKREYKEIVIGGVAYRNTKPTNRTNGLRCIPLGERENYKIYIIYI